MPRGVKTETRFSVDEISEALKKHKGVYTPLCKELRISPDTMTDYMKRHPELHDLVNRLRMQWEEETADEAENTVKRLIKDQENPAIALKSAMYYLNNKAKKRGYAHPDADKHDEKMNPAQALAVAKMFAEEKSNREKDVK